jgi:histone deacetylase 6
MDGMDVDDVAMSDSLQPPPPAEEVSVSSSYDASVNGNPDLQGNALTPPEAASPPADPIDASMADHDEIEELAAFPDDEDQGPPPSHRLGAVEPRAAAIVDSEDTPSHTDSETVSGVAELPKVEVLLTPPPDPVLPYSSSRTGLVYDPRMRFHTELGANEDDIHPEDPRRIFEIFKELKNAGLVENDTPNSAADSDDSGSSAYYPRQRLLRVNARFATPAEICLVHDPAHYEWVKGLESKSCSCF